MSFNGQKAGGQQERADKHFTTDACRFDLLRLHPFLRELADLAAVGAKKYDARNWEKGLPYSEYYNAMHRHLIKWNEVSDSDPENGISHLISVAFYCMALRYFQYAGVGVDDRPCRNGSIEEPSETTSPQQTLKDTTGKVSPAVRIDFNDLFQAACRKTAQGNGGQTLYLATGLAGECGEVCELVKKMTRGSNGYDYQAVKEKMLFELGDVLWYATEMAGAFGFSLSEVMTANMEKLKARVANSTLLAR